MWYFDWLYYLFGLVLSFFGMIYPINRKPIQMVTNQKAESDINDPVATIEKNDTATSTENVVHDIEITNKVSQ